VGVGWSGLTPPPGGHNRNWVAPHAATEAPEAAAPEATEASRRSIAARRRTAIRRRARLHGGIGEELAARMSKKRRVYPRLRRQDRQSK
jgi:hypothetical protein